MDLRTLAGPTGSRTPASPLGAFKAAVRLPSLSSLFRNSTSRRSLRLWVAAGGSPHERESFSGDGSASTNSSDVGVLHVGEEGVNGEKLSGGDMLKLFQDAQENMLFLNKQRLIAIEELQKVERDREFLMAKVAQVEAEFNASMAARETLEQRLRSAEAALEIAESKGSVVGAKARGGAGKSRKRQGRVDPPSVWGSLLVRIDSMLLSGAVSVEQAKSLRKLVSARDIRVAEVFEDLADVADEELGGPLVKLTQGSDKSLHVVQIVTELAPVAQVGSLGSWVMGLCRALRRKGHLVEVILPLYATLNRDHIEGLREHPGELYSFFEDSWHRNKIWSGTVYGVPVTFIEPLHPGNFFDRDRPYGYDDDFERFTYFSRAALEYLLKLEKNPDVIQTHDWQTAVVAPLFWDIYHHQGLKDSRLLFTWHDTHYQNPQPAEKLAKVGLDAWQLNRPDRLQDPRDPSLVNLLKGGIVYSNKVTTVSARYAEDVKTPDYGCSLEDVFKAHAHKILGIPSGLDDSQWDPSKDSFIPMPFSADDDVLTAKAVARSELRCRLGLPLVDEQTGAERPLVVCLVPNLRENEVEVVGALVEAALRSHAQFVFVGSSRSPRAQAGLEEMQREGQSAHAKFVIYYEADVAHLALASAHVVACLTYRDPSFALPMAALKYGALPACRQPLPGLIDIGDPERGRNEGVGAFVPSESVQDLTAGLGRALGFLGENWERWEEWTRRAMQLDLSWDAAGSDAYIQAYWSIYKC